MPIQKNPFKVALYIAMFPQLIAGPIVRYKHVAEEMEDRDCNVEDFAAGIESFIIGLAKKAIIANTLALTVDTIWSQGAGNNTVPVAWLGSIAYSLQIYFDFSGYSDMAIGLGRMFGFHFEENFNHPYVSRNISEFWRRWHISLSSWFRDYVYIPLGGNREHVYLNLAIIFLLTGIWHGAAWHFIAWGIWHGVFVLGERLVRNRVKSTGAAAKAEPGRNVVQKVIGTGYALLVVDLGWVLFRADGLKDAAKFLLNMFGFRLRDITPIYSLSWYLDKWTLLILAIALVCAFDIPRKVWRTVMGRAITNATAAMGMKYIFLIMIFGIAIMRVVAGTYNPFIYYQF